MLRTAFEDVSLQRVDAARFDEVDGHLDPILPDGELVRRHQLVIARVCVDAEDIA